MLKNYFVKCFLARNFHIEITSIVTEFITLLRLNNIVDMMLTQLFVDKIFLCLENFITEKFVI